MTTSEGPQDAGHHHGHGHGAGHGHEHGHDHHGNPPDFGEYLGKLEDPGRDEWQRPDEVVAALGLREGQVACDIGVGPGYFARRLAAAVGSSGWVFGVDVEPRMLGVLAERLQAWELRNVTPVLGLPGDPLLPPASCDLILMVNAYHHFPDGPASLRRLSASLKPGGRLVNIDFHKRELPMGPPPAHKISREEFLAQVAQAGLRVTAEHTFLPDQYFLELKPTDPPRPRKP